MKTDLMDQVQGLLARHKGKGLFSYLVYILIFLFMTVYVVAKPLGNFFTSNKFKHK